MSRQVVTATWLEDLHRSGGEIRVAADALITPAAKDWIKDKAVPIQYLQETSNGRANGPFGLVLNEQQTVQRSIAMNLESKFGNGQRFLIDQDWPSVVTGLRQLCGAIQRETFSHGIVLAEDGTLPVCLANKQKGIRAAAAGSLSAVTEAIRTVGINVLVIEMPNQTYHQIRQIVGRFLKSSGQLPGALVGAFGEIEGA